MTNRRSRSRRIFLDPRRLPRPSKMMSFWWNTGKLKFKVLDVYPSYIAPNPKIPEPAYSPSQRASFWFWIRFSHPLKINYLYVKKPQKQHLFIQNSKSVSPNLQKHHSFIKKIKKCFTKPSKTTFNYPKIKKCLSKMKLKSRSSQNRVQKQSLRQEKRKQEKQLKLESKSFKNYWREQRTFKEKSFRQNIYVLD